MRRHFKVKRSPRPKPTHFVFPSPLVAGLLETLNPDRSPFLLLQTLALSLAFPIARDVLPRGKETPFGWHAQSGPEPPGFPVDASRRDAPFLPLLHLCPWPSDHRHPRAVVLSPFRPRQVGSLLIHPLGLLWYPSFRSSWFLRFQDFVLICLFRNVL